MSHWSSGLPVCFPSWGTLLHPRGGVLMWNRDSPVAVVLLYWWPRHDWSLWPCLRQASSRESLGHYADNVIIPLDLTQLFCPSFTLAAGPPSGFTTDIVSCWGGALCRACISLHSHHVSLVHLLPIMRDLGSILRKHLCETVILLLVLFCYIFFHLQSFLQERTL